LKSQSLPHNKWKTDREITGWNFPPGMEARVMREQKEKAHKRREALTKKLLKKHNLNKLAMVQRKVTFFKHFGWVCTGCRELKQYKKDWNDATCMCLITGLGKRNIVKNYIEDIK